MKKIGAVVQRCSAKKVFLEISQNSQVFSCEFCEISKNTFSHRTSLVAASEKRNTITIVQCSKCLENFHSI